MSEHTYTTTPFRLIVSFVLILLFSSCASWKTQKEQFVDVDRKVAQQDYASAAMMLEASKERSYQKKDRVLYYLDAGMLYYYKPDPQKSITFLTSAEDAIDELYTTSISKGAASLLLNDNVLDYSGEDYENVYLNVFKALSFLRQNEFDPAFVEVRRINNKLSVLKEKYEKLADEYNKSENAKAKFSVGTSKFNNSALGRFLSMLMYRTEGNLDDARIDRNEIDDAWRSQAQLYNFAEPDLDPYLATTDSARIDVIGFVGRAPQLFARNLTIHTFKDAVAIYVSDGKDEQQLDLIPWKDMTSGYHFKFSLPAMERQGTKVRRAAVEVDGSIAGNLTIIESLENTAEDTYKLKEGITYLKTIIRTVTKGILNEKANKELDKKTGGGLFGELTRLATSAVVDASENADLRIARYFPAQALVGEIRVPPGRHSVVIHYYDENGQILFSDVKGEMAVGKFTFNLVQSAYLQ